MSAWDLEKKKKIDEMWAQMSCKSQKPPTSTPSQPATPSPSSSLAHLFAKVTISFPLSFKQGRACGDNLFFVFISKQKPTEDKGKVAVTKTNEFAGKEVQ